MSKHLKPLPLLTRIFLFILIMLSVIGLTIFVRSRFNVIPQLISSNLPQQEEVPFPSIPESGLSQDQKKIIELLKTEYAAQPPGTKYSQGVEEAWCADFVSWIFKQADRPLSNPITSSWRIPGTYTLREYYESKGAFKRSGSNYSPKVGDVMLYDNPSPFGQHVNIVIANDNGIVTTIGGNEPGGIRIVEHTSPDGDGFLGFGVL